jgi:V8-like Glu-specific endopeptidase
VPKQILERNERNRLIDIIADWDTGFKTVTDRERFFRDAELAWLVNKLNLEGSANTVASNLVGRLESFGTLPGENNNRHSLGALLKGMLDQQENGNSLNQDDEKFIACLIFRYSLIYDPVYLDELSVKYKFTETEVRRQIPSDIIFPRIRSEESKSPEFRVQIDDEQALEQIINSEDNFLDIEKLQGALYCAKAVGMIEIPEGSPKGTGFLVGPDMLLTNKHVLKSKDNLKQAVVRFGFMKDLSGVSLFGKVVRMQPDYYHDSPEHLLDYALVRLQQKPLEDITISSNELKLKSMQDLIRIGKHRGYIELSGDLDPIEDTRANIIQHPNKMTLQVVMTQNRIVKVTEKRVQYVADTMGGSSGSPVFNERWHIIALHHSGSPYPSEALIDTAKKAWKGKFRVNEGIPIRAILEDFEKRGILSDIP